MKLYYGHLFCHVLHQNYIVKKGVDIPALKKELFASSKRIYYIPLGYNFDKYFELEKGNSLQIRNENKSKYDISRFELCIVHQNICDFLNWYFFQI